jgi:hypothetical protein
MLEKQNGERRYLSIRRFSWSNTSFLLHALGRPGTKKKHETSLHKRQRENVPTYQLRVSEDTVRLLLDN